MRINIRELECKCCGHRWIPRKSKINMCPNCKTLRWYISSRKESDRHMALKERAKQFLLELGCEDIQTEHIINKVGKRIANLICDVSGWQRCELLVVECGSFQDPKKLRKLNKAISKGEISRVFIWGYGDDSPYEWHYGIDICPRCGRQW